MPKCEFCGEIIWTDEEFILAGKYPGGGKIMLHSGVISWVPPETYGKIYHKACFLKLGKKEQEGDEARAVSAETI